MSVDSSLKNLSIHERIRLVEDLWGSIASAQNSISLSSAQKAELDKRLEAYEATEDRGHPATKLFRKSEKNCELQNPFPQRSGNRTS